MPGKPRNGPGTVSVQEIRGDPGKNENLRQPGNVVTVKVKTTTKGGAALPKPESAAAFADRGALLEQWMQEYGTRIMHLAYLYLKDRQLAEDLTQEVFIKAYRHMDEFRGESAVYTWLYRIAINLCRDRLRSPWWKRLILPGEVPAVASGDQPEEAALTTLRKEAVIQQVLALPDHYREMIILYYYQDLSTTEIAGLTGLPENTVKTRLHRARQHLKQALAREGVTP